jgi:D-alanyl-D-alanine carboxypeptidase
MKIFPPMHQRFFLKIGQVLALFLAHSQVQAQIEWKPFLTDTTHLVRKLGTIYSQTSIPLAGGIMVKSDTVLAVVVRGKNRAYGETIGENNLVHLGSNTMAVTAYIAARLVHDQKIRWNTSFYDLYPKLQAKTHPSFKDATLTLSELLSHRAGIVPFASAAEFDIASKVKGKGKKQMEKFAALVLGYPKLEAPFTFSNAGYSLAALMMEKSSGKSWSQLLDQYLKKDLGCDFFIGLPQEKSKYEAWGHFAKANDTVFQELRPEMKYKLPGVLNPALNLSMSPRHYAIFMQHLLRGLLGKTNLPKSLFEALCLSNEGYAMGWAHMEDGNGNVVIIHDGTSGFHFMRTTILPEYDLAFSVLTNTFGGRTDPIIQQLNEEILEKLAQFEELQKIDWQKP